MNLHMLALLCGGSIAIQGDVSGLRLVITANVWAGGLTTRLAKNWGFAVSVPVIKKGMVGPAGWRIKVARVRISSYA